MSEGVVKENGTKRDLKEKFRCGYTLECDLRPLLSGEAQSEDEAAQSLNFKALVSQVRALASEHLGGAGSFTLFAEDANGKASVEKKFVVTIKYTQSVADQEGQVADLLDALKGELGLERVKMNLMNLEEVFVKVCLGVDPLE